MSLMTSGKSQFTAHLTAEQNAKYNTDKVEEMLTLGLEKGDTVEVGC